MREHQLAPTGVSVHNPAFDVTPNEFIAAIITDKGVARPPLQKACAVYLKTKCRIACRIFG
jgi:methylthioribose-1-phosphate isomerase